ncbi:MAG: hypothetical protein R3F55_24140 [Alphaproteobacteria bacterium]
MKSLLLATAALVAAAALPATAQQYGHANETFIVATGNWHDIKETGAQRCYDYLASPSLGALFGGGVRVGPQPPQSANGHRTFLQPDVVVTDEAPPPILITLSCAVDFDPPRPPEMPLDEFQRTSTAFILLELKADWITPPNGQHLVVGRVTQLFNAFAAAAKLAAYR